MPKIFPVLLRLAELSTKHERMPAMFSEKDQRELTHCLRLVTDYVWEVQKLKALSLVAFEADDYEWQHELCARLDQRKEEIL